MWCIDKWFPRPATNNTVINISVMLTEQTVRTENSLLGRGAQIDSLVKHCGLLYVTDARINL